MAASILWLDNAPPCELENFYAQLQARAQESLSDSDVETLGDFFRREPDKLKEFHHLLHCSEFIQREVSHRPEILHFVIANKLLGENVAISQLFTQSADNETLEHFDRQLRELRARSMLRITWRDLNRQASLEDTCAELSELARFCIGKALDFHYAELTAKHGRPRCKRGREQALIVLGMGKLGAGELNLSSDIDLIFAYPEKGSTDNAKNGLDNQEFFSRLGKKIIHSLDNLNADGFVFRVDMRLRPYGQSGALVYSFAALEEYYQNQGREWERYAMVKASIVANNGDKAYGDELMDMLSRFTYRKYVDFSVIEALRSLKKMIRQEVKRRKLEEDIKLGDGGIREIEFTAQVFQLIRGGKEPHLRDNRILKILPLLSEDNCLPQEDVEALIQAYHFLRNTEHAIQAYGDKQTQKLPAGRQEQQILATAMGFATWEDFYNQLRSHRQAVKQVFDELIAAPEPEPNEIHLSSDWQDLWLKNQGKDAALEQLEAAGHDRPDTSLTLIAELRSWADNHNMHSSSRQRLDSFMPALLAALADRPQATELFRRCVSLIKSVARRSAYLLLLIENPKALEQLLDLSAASPWFADRMAEHPALLDELLDPRALFHLPAKDELRAELQQAVLRIAQDDLEAQMDVVRYFASAHALRVAACELTGALPLMKVSDYLTVIAEVILDYVLGFCWKELCAKHGFPDGEQHQQAPFIIIGYGKLGGIELGHGSDLDLVFIHNASLNGHTDGPRALDNQTFFTRLGQKIIHFVTTNMPSGSLYDIDMRLRPSGNSGMLVTRLSSFAQYQENQAWTWEHQALVRARVVAGDPILAEEFVEVRKNVLCRVRDEKSLAQEVVDMRRKMREHLGSKANSDSFDLKHDTGGIVDIEFMVQYGVLAWASSHPAITEFTDNIRILESFADASLLSAQEAEQLINAYKAFRAAGHRLALQQQENRVDIAAFADEKHHVTQIWQRIFAVTQ